MKTQILQELFWSLWLMYKCVFKADVLEIKYFIAVSLQYCMILPHFAGNKNELWITNIEMIYINRLIHNQIQQLNYFTFSITILKVSVYF